ncbi:MAG: glycosyltransferase [Bacteroidia bacterium]|nr:glycosyltransferase [Bacteroidia bacterium]
MKILQVSNRVPYPLNEGGTIGIYNYTRGFAEQGCEVTLLAQAAKKHQINLMEARAELEKYCRFEVFPVDTDVRPWPALKNLFTNKSYNVERFYDAEFEKALIHELQNNTYDVIQIEGTFPALYSETIFKYKGDSKVVLRQHNVEFQIWDRLSRNSKNPLKKWYFGLLSRRLKAFEKLHLNQYAALVPVTHDDGELFKSMGCRIPVFPSPAGIDTTKWSPSANEDTNAIYHIGSLEWMPNVEALLWFLDEVWPHILDRNPAVTFHVAGKAMPDYIRSMKLTNVHMVGEVESATQFVEDKGITVVPLKSGSGIRLKILEAMSAGKTVISTTIGAQGIDYTQGLNILIADTAEEFADSVVRVVEDQTFNDVLKSGGRKLIEDQYSNQSVVKRLVAFYSNLD